MHAARAELYAQSDLVLSLKQSEGALPATESAVVTTARLVAALAAMLAASDTKKRLRTLPLSGSVELLGGSGPSQI